MMHDALIHDEIEMRDIEVQRSPVRSLDTDVWKWLAGSLFAILLAVGGYMSRGGITRAEAVELIASPANPYVRDEPVLQQRMKAVDEKLSEMQASQAAQQRTLTRICIALKVAPDVCTN